MQDIILMLIIVNVGGKTSSNSRSSRDKRILSDMNSMHWMNVVKQSHPRSAGAISTTGIHSLSLNIVSRVQSVVTDRDEKKVSQATQLLNQRADHGNTGPTLALAAV